MFRKALTLGMVFIFALSLLAASMITCFTYEAEAHGGYWCCNPNPPFQEGHFGHKVDGWICSDWYTH